MRCCGVDLRYPGRRSGVTLVETVFASALGALLLVALLNLYQRSVAAHAFAESRNELAETLFVAERILADELHLAAGAPCGERGNRFNLVRSGGSTAWLRLPDAPVQIADSGAGDEVVVLKTGAPAPLTGHDPARARLTLAHAGAFKRGGLVVVCDDRATVLLQLTHTADGGRTLGYGADPRVRPGNCASPFTAGCGPAGHRFAPGALVAPYEPVVFLTAESGGRHSLYRRRLVVVNAANGNVTAQMRREETVTGVASLRARAGAVDSAGRVHLARAPFAGRAVLLDFGLAALARERNADVLPGEALHLFGEPAGGWLSAGDAKHLSAVHEFSVAL